AGRSRANHRPRLRGSRARVRPIVVYGCPPARTEGQEVTPLAPWARLGGVAAQRESVEGPGQAAPDLTEERVVPVDGVDLGRSVGTQVAVARAQRAGVDAPRVDGGHAVQ